MKFSKLFLSECLKPKKKLCIKFCCNPFCGLKKPWWMCEWVVFGFFTHTMGHPCVATHLYFIMGWIRHRPQILNDKHIFPINRSANPISVYNLASLPCLLLIHFNDIFEDLPLKKVNILHQYYCNIYKFIILKSCIYTALSFEPKGYL